MRLFDKKKERKPFKETKVGIFLKEKAPKIIDKIGDLLPDKGILGVVAKLIKEDDAITPEDREHALRLLDYEIQEIQEVTKRWVGDAMSDSWLSKNIRPLTLAYLMLVMTVLVILDSIENTFVVKDVWVTLVGSLLTTTVIAYFGSRGIEKYRKIKNGSSN